MNTEPLITSDGTTGCDLCFGEQAIAIQGTDLTVCFACVRRHAGAKAGGVELALAGGYGRYPSPFRRGVDPMSAAELVRHLTVDHGADRSMAVVGLLAAARLD